MKSKYQTHVKPRFDEIKKWLQRGALDKEIIKALGIGKSAYYDYLNKYTEFSELIKENRINPVEEIKCSMFKRATGFHYQETKTTITYIELNEDLKNALFEAGVNPDNMTRPKEIKKEISEKYALPDAASGMILLKHWAPDEGWTNDPQTLALKREEFEHKKKIDEMNYW